MEKLILLDTETTGVSSTDRIISLAMKKLGREETTLYELFSIGEMKIPLEAMSVNNITNKMLEGKRPISDYKSFIDNYLADSVIIAHNAKFDIGMLKNEHINLPINPETGEISQICTLKVAQNVVPWLPQYKLNYLRYYFEVEGDFHNHNAKDDVLILEWIFYHLFNKVKEVYNIEWATEEEITNQVIMKMKEISSAIQYLEIFPFWKHKWLKLNEIPDDYLFWTIEQDFIKENKNETLYYSVKREIRARHWNDIADKY